MSQSAAALRTALPAQLDGRSREGRFIRSTRADLLAHVGDAPSPIQRALVDRAAWLQLHLGQLDASAASGGGLGTAEARQYLEWSNHLTRTLRELVAAPGLAKGRAGE